jgi:hypothetical protein
MIEVQRRRLTCQPHSPEQNKLVSESTCHLTLGNSAARIFAMVLPLDADNPRRSRVPVDWNLGHTSLRASRRGICVPSPAHHKVGKAKNALSRLDSGMSISSKTLPHKSVSPGAAFRTNASATRVSYVQRYPSDHMSSGPTLTEIG